MQPRDESQQNAELRQAFINHLPRRIELVQKRAQRVARGAFDINLLTLLLQEVQALAGAAGRYGLLGPGERLFALEQLIARFKVAAVELSDDDRKNLEARALGLEDPADPQLKVRISLLDVAPRLEQMVVANSPLLGRYVAAPGEYWRRFSASDVSALFSDDPGCALEPRTLQFEVKDQTPRNDIETDDGLLSVEIGTGDLDDWERPNARGALAEHALDRPEFTLEDLQIVSTETSSLLPLRQSNLPITRPIVPVAAPVFTPSLQAVPTLLNNDLNLLASSHRPMNADDAQALVLASSSEWSIQDEHAAHASAQAPEHFEIDVESNTRPIEPLLGLDLSALENAAEVTRRVFYLSEPHAHFDALTQKLTESGLSVDRIESVEELIDTLSNMTADVVLIDQQFVPEIDAIGDFLKTIRSRTVAKMPVVAFAETTDLAARLRAMRLGIDLLLSPQLAIDDLHGRIQDLLSHDVQQPFRIMIVEDDRSQALFAESVLRKSGMDVLVVLEPFNTLEALEQYRPDLILMDLYMPGIDGIELTSIIRERDEFISTPIVFLSGEQDSDKQFDAISAGGDDFLAKPIRPKHLISSVTNRARRARAMRERKKTTTRDLETGLFDRSFVLDKLAEAMVVEDRAALPGGVILLELQQAAEIRLAAGVAGLDAAIQVLSKPISELLRRGELVARYSDSSLVVICTDGQAAAERLAQLDTQLTDRAQALAWHFEGAVFGLRCVTGRAKFSATLIDPAQMVQAADRAARAKSNNVVPIRREPSPSVALPHVEGATTAATANSFIRADAMDLSVDDELQLPQLADDVKSAIKNDGFQLLFEPVVSLQGASEAQFEALLRLSTSSGETLKHQQLVERAFEHGLNAEIDRWLCNRAMATLDERIRSKKPLQRLFVRQSGDSLKDSQRVAWLKQSLETRRLDPATLYLSFHLKDVIRELKHAIGFFQALHAIGVRLVLDEFESNLTSLQLLSYLPVDALKLASMYTQAGNSKRDEIETLVRSARAGGKQVIAAGIEDARAASQLWTLGVDLIQGNFVQSAGSDLSFDFRASVF